MVNKKVQGYIQIDNKKMTDEEFEQFEQFLNKYFVNYKKIGVINGREYDNVILRNVDLINDSTDEDGNTIYGMLSLMKDRNILINGIWDKDGMPYGKEKVIEQQGEGEDATQIIKYVGTATYPFDLGLHLKYTPDIVVYDDEGNEISRSKAMQFNPLNKFSGWGNIKEY